MKLMMMNWNFKSAVAVLILLLTGALSLITSCDFSLGDDDDPKNELEKLPPITQTGENTFGFLLNGRAIVVDNTLNFVAMNQGGFFYLGGGGVSLYKYQPFEVNVEYSLTDLDLGKVEYKTFVSSDELCYYDSTATFSGQLKFLNFNTSEFIASGTFEFSTVTEDCDTVRITDGRFDMQYIP